MQLRALNHLIDSVRGMARSKRIVVLGSSSLLPWHPELGDPHGPLDATYDADFLLDPTSKEIALFLSEAMGQGSQFRSIHGYHLDVLHPTIVESLPKNWESRLRPLAGYDNVWSLDPVDLAMVKVCVGREKDLRLVRELLNRKLIDPKILRDRFSEVMAVEKELFRAGRNLSAVLTHE